MNGAMSSSAPGPRPRQVTIGGWLSAVTSTVLVVSVFDAMANLRSVDTRERLTSALTGWPKDLGISVDDAIALTRGALFVTAVAAVVTAILGIFVLQRHATARIVLTVAAVPLVLTSPVAGGFLGLLVGGASAMLCTREARDWFAGRAPTREPASVQRQSARTPEPPVESGPAQVAPPPMPGWGQAQAERASWPPPADPSSSAVRVSAAVPTQVRVACGLTWVFSMLTAASYVAIVIAVAVDRGKVIELARDNADLSSTSITDSELIGLLVAVSAVLIAWCIVAAVLAALLWRRQPVAWAFLVGSAVAASLLSLVALPYSAGHLVACAATFMLLLRPTTRAWLRSGRGPAAPTRVESWPPPNPQDQDPSGKPPVW